MVAEVYAIDRDDGEEDDPLNHAVQDGGASSVLGSYHSVHRYLMHLLHNGYNLSDIEVFECDKGFRYGNSETEVTGRCILLPVVMGGRMMKVLTYLIQGTVPILFGRRSWSGWASPWTMALERCAGQDSPGSPFRLDRGASTW